MQPRLRGNFLVTAVLAFLLTLIPQFSTVFAQSTTFTYQGRLNDNGAPATGIYDLRFAIYDSTNSPGTLIAGPVTNSAVAANNGLFTATLDFGPGVFTGPDRWLQIAVRTNGGDTFADLTPRQPLTPVPYAIFAGSASNLLGTIPAAQLTGTVPLAQLPAAVVTNNAGAVNLLGTFTGTVNATNGNVATTNFVLNNFAVSFPTNPVWQTNLTTGGSNYIVNTEVPDGTVVVCPYSNLPPAITNNPRYFGPWKGADYVQQAINFCAQYPDRITGVGGGKVLIVGINYCPAPLIFTNALQIASSYSAPSSFTNSDNITSFDLEAPAFTVGALVCSVNPCIRLGGEEGSPQAHGVWLYNSVTFTMKNLIVSSLDNSPTNLFEMRIGIARLYLGYNWFGYWGTLTNHQDLYGLAGLTVPTINVGIAPHNLTIELIGGEADLYTVENNSFLGIQGVYFNPDHGTFRDNFFSFCGGSSAWTKSAWAAGATIIVGQNVNSDRVFEHNYFYGCPYTYLTSQGGYINQWTSAAAGRDIAIGDCNVEGTYNTIRVNNGYILQFGGAGMLKGSSFAATMTGGDLGAPPTMYPNATITIGAVTNDYRFNMDASGFTLSSGTFNGNGGGLNNLNASALTAGALPSAQLSGSYPNTVALQNPANSFSGSFTGNGSGLAFTNAAGAAFRLAVNAATNGFIFVPQ